MMLVDLYMNLSTVKHRLYLKIVTKDKLLLTAVYHCKIVDITRGINRGWFQ